MMDFENNRPPDKLRNAKGRYLDVYELSRP
jgi:hypothetical protein